MEIYITPHEIIERALWDDYQYFILSKDKKADIEKIIEENEKFQISETDALVIGLLKCIETDNLVHRCNQYIENLMSVRSMKRDNTIYLKKKILVDSLHKFKKKFPDTWKPRPHYAHSLESLNKYIDNLLEKVETLKMVEITDKYGTHELIRIIHIKKILDFHHK